jgi:hypothetical protein
MVPAKCPPRPSFYLSPVSVKPREGEGVTLVLIGSTMALWDVAQALCFMERILITFR